MVREIDKKLTHYLGWTSAFSGSERIPHIAFPPWTPAWWSGRRRHWARCGLTTACALAQCACRKLPR